MEKKKYPIGPEHYTIYEVIGQGVSALVHRALCIPFDEVVAIKILDFERDNCDLNNISREAQTMMLVDHLNLLKSHCSFVSDHNLWVVMPYMSGGSCLHILKAAYPDGFEEVIIATILREALKGLDYLHQHGHIHRDVKAGNILLGARGAIKLGDFGVSACLFDSGDRQRTRNTFVGTPCWMAPEVMEQLHGYDFKADIWSFGITGLELAHGHAPFSKYPPMKVLLMTLQNAPPGLDYERDRKFSRSFKQMIASCLVKDPSKRPSAKKLLKHSFFKQARSSDYIARKLLDGLPDLVNRVQAIKKKEEDMLAQEKMADGEKEELSQNEYKRGISGWNFNLDDMKAQASLIQDIDCGLSESSLSESTTSLQALDSQDMQLETQEDTCQLPNKYLQPLIHRTLSIARDKSDDDISLASPSYDNYVYSSPRHEDLSLNNTTVASAHAINEKSTDSTSITANQPTEILAGSCVSKGESDKTQDQLQNGSTCNGAHPTVGGDEVPTELAVKPPRALSASLDESDDKSKPPVVQQRGRFKVTSENLDIDKVVPSPILQKSHSMQVCNSSEVLGHHSAASLPPSVSGADVPLPNLTSSYVYPLVYPVLQTNILERDNILHMMKVLTNRELTEGRSAEPGSVQQPNVAPTEKSMLEAAHEREKDLLHDITDLQWRLICAEEELQKYKTEHAHV
ncbi:STE20/SPS1-related proline-alanine-rich protein kinase isoform X1 [Brassica napus]|nr:PREDICTED: STE20/SPS1-related proline-alanine-rich protein kinase-like isoform X1 [Brassica oleracea var. oleracea]XP_013592543.1 PREDICTED: STE20/SPS1-related proline-alanine-rich protein kinase-like isoform X1 [Brassica oleracea var. oleracea]XP_013592544.1 PREDICTED: STE20/SPS1-related proline-alanine-rich protein kinase-like isoform X1 [Brassica oleracea var. oleracea]XP_022560674.2 STE20/SPS1-related proline-alanine-rich protein kinase isoform X1 [Brassica napus]XP_022560677.2 STE20/SPS